MGIGRPGAESSAQKELRAESGPVDFSSLSMENIWKLAKTLVFLDFGPRVILGRYVPWTKDGNRLVEELWLIDLIVYTPIESIWPIGNYKSNRFGIRDSYNRIGLYSELITNRIGLERGSN